MPGLWTVARYGSPGFTLAFAALPLYLLTPALYAEQLGLSLGAVGIVLMLTRLTDAIADPIIGRWMDQHSTGLWQWLWLGLAVMAIGLSLLVNPPAWLHEASPSGGLMLLWMGLCALIVSLANSVATLAHQSWAVAWTAELRSQSRLIAAREFWALIGVIVAAVIAAQRSGVAMGITAIASAALALALAYGLRAHGAQTRHHRSGAVAPVGWRAMLAFPEFRTLLSAFSVNALANAIPATLVLFFLSDVLGASRDQSSLLLALYFLAAALSVAFWSWLAQRWGALQTWRVAMGMAIVAFIWALGLSYGDLTSFTIICLLTGFALGAELVCPPVLLGQIIAHNGHRGQLESSYFGLWNLVIKLALAAAAGLTLPALTLLDYTPGQSSPNAEGALALQWVYAGIPCALKMFSLLWLGTSSLSDLSRKDPQ